MGNDKLIVESVGIELETEMINRGNIPGVSTNETIYQASHDASIESELLSFNGIPVESTLEMNLGLRNAVFGTEFISGIINTEKPYLSSLKQLTNFLISNGENPKSYRAGFHVHVNTPYNLVILKSIIRLARHLEQVFFLLGGMGYDYRGKKNDSIYCRPITKAGPVCVHISPRSFGQVFTVKDLLESRSTSEFKERYGDYEFLNPRIGRYMPVRYHWINLKPMFEQGSLEFRVFNKSLNPHYLWAIIEFCKAFVYFAMESSFSTLKEDKLLKENSVFDIKGIESDREKIIHDFNKFIRLTRLGEKESVLEVLNDILYKSDINAIALPEQYTFTHLMNYNGEDRCPRHWDHPTEYTPNKIIKTHIKVPDFIDLYQQRRTTQATTTSYSRSTVREELLTEETISRIRSVSSGYSDFVNRIEEERARIQALNNARGSLGSFRYSISTNPVEQDLPEEVEEEVEEEPEDYYLEEPDLDFEE